MAANSAVVVQPDTALPLALAQVVVVATPTDAPSAAAKLDTYSTFNGRWVLEGVDGSAEFWAATRVYT